jgi:hypothetical protein
MLKPLGFCIFYEQNDESIKDEEFFTFTDWELTFDVSSIPLFLL